MKLNPHIQIIDELSSDVIDRLRTITTVVNLDDPMSLTKEEAFYDACNRYDAETKYFNADHNYYSGVLPSKELATELKWYHDLLTTKYFPEHTIFRSQVVRNVPGKIVNPHIDPRLYHRLSHRVHAVISTNAQAGHVYFDETTHEAEIFQMHSGFLYDFDNITPHAAFNLGETGRLHIISDVIDNKWTQQFALQFKENPNMIPPGVIDEYYSHLRAIEQKYGGADGLREHYKASLNIS